MENRINNRVVIAVNKKSKLLRYLRKLNSGDMEKISVRMIGTPKEKPINLFFTENLITNKFTGIGAVDSFLVYARYSKPEGGKAVLLGSATIDSLQKLGFTLVDNKESDECVSINIYAKGQDALDFKELKDILLSLTRLSTYLSTYPPISASSTVILELKPENQNIVSYEVSIVPAVKTGKAQEHSVNPSVSQNDPSLKEDTNSSAVKEKITTMASFVFRRDAYKYAKKLNKILSVGEINIQADSLTKVGKISSFKSRIDIKGNNYTVVAISELDEQIAMDYYNRHKYSIHKSSQFAVGALFGYQDYVKNMITGAISKRLLEIKQNKIARKNLSRALKTTTGDIPTRELCMTEKEKSPISDYSPEIFVDTIDNKIKTESVLFGCSIPNIFIQRLTIKDSGSINTANLSAMFEVGNKVFKGTIAKASVDADNKQVIFPVSNSASTTVSLEILIDNDSKKIIQNLLDKTGLKTAAVGKLMLATTINDNINYESTDIHISLQQIGVIWVNKDSLLNNSNSKKSNSTATESEKNTQEVLKQRHNTDSKKSNSKQLEIVIASSMIKSDLKKPLKKWRKILEVEPIEILTDIHLKAGHILGFYIRESTFGINGVVVDDKIIYRYELVAKCSAIDRNITSRNGGTTISGFVLKALRNAYIKYKQRKSENLDISHLGSVLKKLQKTSNQKEDLFCNKAKASSKKNNDTARPYQLPNPVMHPILTILGKSDSKDMIKEIIKEANRSEKFPYKLDYDNNCVIVVSNSLFSVLEHKNKLENVLRLTKVIDAGVFHLGDTGNLIFKKMFNISSLTVYYSPSKNLYVLIGA